MFYSLISYAQRNRLQIIGLEYDNLLGGVNEDRANNDNSANRYAFCAGYERSFGSRVSLGLSFFIYVSTSETSHYFEINNVKSKSSPLQYAASGLQTEKTNFKILYSCKYFFNEFDQEPEGTYFGTMIGINTISNSIDNYSIKPNLQASGIEYPGIESSYSALRYGFKFGVQYNGDFYIGALLNTPLSGNASSFSNKDGYEFDIGSIMIPVNFIIGYNWGINF